MSYEDEPIAADATPSDEPTPADEATADELTLFGGTPSDESPTEETTAVQDTPSEKPAWRARGFDPAPAAADQTLADEPPATKPPATEPTATEPTATEKSPSTEPPATKPPATEPTATEKSPATKPTATEPTATEKSPATKPPATEPTATETSPSTEPPATEPTATEESPSTEPPATEPQLGGFRDLGLKPALLTALTGLGYEEPTPIQRQAIPLMLGGGDMLGQAATGTGKTAAFALPILNGIDRNDAAIPLALIVVPTRELAVQVSEAFFKYGRESRVQVLPVFGGQPISRQLQALKRGVHVVVGTPGRVIDHIKRGSLNLDAVQTVVLDEADEMLDMGFTEDIEAILRATPDSRQTVLFSATMPPRIEKLARKYQRDPQTVKIGKTKGEEANPLIRQTVYMVLRSHKASALGRILDVEAPESTIVFCRTRHEVDELTVTMNGRGYRAEALHGGMDQKQRDRVMARLRDGTAELLIATDVAARGLDVDTLTHVVNYDVPSAPESYVHRIGRVGRAGREGVAITIAEPKQRRLLGNIERLTKQKFEIAKVPSVADLRTRQIEMTVGSVRDALAIDDLADYRAVLDALGDEYSERDIALAAIKLVHRARGATIDEREIPDASDWKNNKFDKGGKGKGSKFDKGGKGKSDKGGKGRSFDGEKGYVHVNLGRNEGLRPGDLVGAIANEAGLSGSDIGPIKIQDHWAVVGVPESEVESIVKKMKRTTIRGNEAKLRRYTD
jgi:ATP-dependent RNA helicase DeaD